MSAITVLTFYDVGTSITFDDEQLHQIDVIHYQQSHLDKLQNGAARLTLMGNERREAIIDIKNRGTAADDIATLIAWTNVVGMRLDNLRGTQQEIMAVRIDPNATIHYFQGEKDYVKLIRIRVIESTATVIPIELYNDFIGV